MRALLIVAFLVAGCGPSAAPAWRAPTGPATAFLAIEHLNSMSAGFELIGLRMLVDEREVLTTESEQPLPQTVCAYRGAVSAGTHRVRVEARYRGHGFGVFSYLNQYRFSTRALADVVVPSDALGVMVRSEGYESGGVTAPLEDRPHIRFFFAIERANAGGGCFPSSGTEHVLIAPEA